jgi:cysteine-rich repeat protein
MSPIFKSLSVARSVGWWSLAGVIAVAACSDDPNVRVPDSSVTPSVEGAETDAQVAECDQAPQGTPCGKPGSENHCVFNACVRNVCGDGVKAGTEECDDGDEIDHDGCSALCRLDTPSCGNGVLDPFEECDEGPDNGGECTARCTNKRCGDGIVSPGEECDEGRNVDSRTCLQSCRRPSDSGVQDAGREAGASPGGGGPSDAGGGGPMDAGVDASHEAGAEAGSEAGAEGGGAEAGSDGGGGLSCSDAGGPSVSACRQCRVDHCTDFNGLDLVKRCLEEIGDPSWDQLTPQQPRGSNGTADPNDPLFLQQCIDVVQCTQLNRNCGSSVQAGSGCYCGSRDENECNTTGPGANAACVAQWRAAARATLNADVQAAFSNLSLPAGWAFFLLDCDRQFCNTQCLVPDAACASTHP